MGRLSSNERRSLGITSNLVFSEREKVFANPMATAAAIDRIVHHSVILEFDLPSYRTDPVPDGPQRIIAVDVGQLQSNVLTSDARLKQFQRRDSEYVARSSACVLSPHSLANVRAALLLQAIRIMLQE